MLTPVVIDLSHHNTIPQSLQPANDSGILGVIHKATEGVTFTDSKLKARRSLAKQAGQLWGVYHFVRPGSIGEQVAFFCDTAINAELVPGDSQDWLWALDYEDPDVSIDDVVEFLERLESFVARSPVLYSGHVLKDALQGRADARLEGYRLWLAQYGPEAKLPPGWDSYWLWQYTDQGKVPGINPPVDLNAYAGPVDQLAAEWAGKAPAPELRPVVKVGVNAPPGVGVTLWLNGELVYEA